MEMTSYSCPKCGIPSSNMEIVIGESYTPTPVDLARRIVPEEISHEVLICPCGGKYNWFTLSEERWLQKDPRYKDEARLKAYAQLLMAAIGFCAAIYLLITGTKPPPAQQVLREYS